MKPIFHPVEGRADCLACHGDGKADAPRLDDRVHLGMSSIGCPTCHTPAAGSSAAVYSLALPFCLVLLVGARRLVSL